MRVIPGSHKGSHLLKHHTNTAKDLTLNQGLDADQYEDAVAADIILKPGHMSFHDINMVHGSRHNASNRRRAGYLFRFMPATSHLDRNLGNKLGAKSGVVDFKQRALYLVHSEDKAANDLRIGHAH